MIIFLSLLNLFFSEKLTTAQHMNIINKNLTKKHLQLKKYLKKFYKKLDSELKEFKREVKKLKNCDKRVLKQQFMNFILSYELLKKDTFCYLLNEYNFFYISKIENFNGSQLKFFDGIAKDEENDCFNLEIYSIKNSKNIIAAYEKLFDRLNINEQLVINMKIRSINLLNECLLKIYKRLFF